MVELLVILGSLVALLLSVVIMNIYRWRTDVLIGPYISRDSQPAVSETGGDTGSRGNTISSATSNRWRRLRLKRTSRSRHAPTSQKADVSETVDFPDMSQAEQAIRPGSSQFYARSTIALIRQIFTAGSSGKIWRWLPTKAPAHRRRSRASQERRSNAVEPTPGEPFGHTKLGSPATFQALSHAALILPEPWRYHPESFLPGVAFPPAHSADSADLTRFSATDRQESRLRFR